MTDDRFEATFIVARSRDDVWKTLEDGERAGGRWWLPGFEAEIDVGAVEPGHELRGQKVTPPCEGTEIVVTMEHEASGTKVTVVQSGFGDFFAAHLDMLAVGWSHIAADVALYLERGVRGRRHVRPWAMLGCTLRTAAWGMEVDSVSGGFAQRAGLAPGDVLLTVGGAPLVEPRELATVMRVFGTGDDVEATWARGDELQRAVAAL